MEFTLTPEKIKEYRECIASTVPYTEEEADAIEFDGEVDLLRYRAYLCKGLLEEYGIPLTEEFDEHE